MRKSEIGFLEMNSQLAAEILNQFGNKVYTYLRNLEKAGGTV